MKIRLVAIIVTYNPDLNDLHIQIEALIQKKDIEIVIVDNCSSNIGEIEKFTNKMALNFLRLIKNQKNLGLSLAQNIGIEFARTSKATHVIFFDQDSIPEPRFCSSLLESENILVERGVKVGAIGPIFFDTTSKKAYPVTKFWGPFIHRIHPEEEQIIEASFIISSGSLVRMEILEKVGYMMEKLFIDYIDVEWCFRAKSLGFSSFVTTKAKMTHKIGDKRINFLGRSISSHSNLRRYYLTRNSFLMVQLKYIPFSYKVREISLNFLRITFFFFLAKNKIYYLRFMLKAVKDGIAGKFNQIEP